MAIGTITKVYEKNEEKNWPGSVVFSDGKKLSTFDEALIATALGGVGQIAEYTTERKGKYENLKTLALKGAAPAQQQPSEAPASGSKVVDFGGAVVASAVKELTAAVRELTSALGRAPRAGVNPVTVAAGALEPQPVVDPLVAAEAALARAVESPDAARAMFDAMKAKHKDPAKLTEAIAKCLKAHGVEA